MRSVQLVKLFLIVSFLILSCQTQTESFDSSFCNISEECGVDETCINGICTLNSTTENSDIIHDENSHNRDDSANHTPKEQQNEDNDNYEEELCKRGKVRCNDKNIEICADGDGDGVVGWTVVVTCEGDEICRGKGKCGKDECLSGQKRCSGDNIEECLDKDSNNFMDWEKTGECTGTETCRGEGVCSSDSCIKGEKRCNGNGVESCLDENSDGFFEWENNGLCQGSDMCRGEGVCGLDECGENEKRCSENNIQQCDMDGENLFRAWKDIKACTGVVPICSAAGIGPECVECAANSDCSGDDVCTMNSCCTKECSGKCAGASDGCGGVCGVNDCNGCCDAAGSCNESSNSKCGTEGKTCMNCDTAYPGRADACASDGSCICSAEGRVCGLFEVCCGGGCVENKTMPLLKNGSHNPVLGAVKNNPLHEKDSIEDPEVIKIDDETFFMYYSATGKGGQKNIFLATSVAANGKAGHYWHHYPDQLNPQPVLLPESSADLSSPSIVKSGDIFHMYYKVSGSDLADEIHLATSRDAISWNKEGKVLEISPSKWDGLSIGNPSVVLHDGVFYLFYTGRDSSTTVENAGVATCSDGTGKNFVKSQENPIYIGSSSMDVALLGNTFTMFMEKNGAISSAISNDGTNWCDRGNAVSKSGAAWDKYDLITPSILAVDGVFHSLFVSGASISDRKGLKIGEIYSTGFSRPDDPAAGCSSCSTLTCTDACREIENSTIIDGYCAFPGSFDSGKCCACPELPYEVSKPDKLKIVWDKLTDNHKYSLDLFIVDQGFFINAAPCINVYLLGSNLSHEFYYPMPGEEYISCSSSGKNYKSSKINRIQICADDDGNWGDGNSICNSVHYDGISKYIHIPLK